jgi:hypothetical protein
MSPSVFLKDITVARVPGRACNGAGPLYAPEYRQD